MEKKRKKLYKKLKSRYRLVVMNDETFEERASVILSPLNVFILGSIAALALIAAGIVMIAFTPMREYIPGYMDVSLSKKLVKTSLRLDSLERALILKERYITNINKIIVGEKNKERGTKSKPVISSDRMKKTDIENNLVLSSLLFFTPVKGYVTTSFNAVGNHLGTDIATPKNEPVKTVLDGMVIFTAWTPETGYVISVQHEYNLVSFYKHNGFLTRKEGEKLKAGDIIAIAGEGGELSTGPHLHFELWHNGHPANPEDYIIF